MLEHTVAAYTFSKSYSMSGWRIGFAVAAPAVVDAIGKLINTSASCSPPLAQRAAQAALEYDAETRDDYMERFRRKVERLCDGLERVDGFRVGAQPARFMSSRTSRGLQPPANHLARAGALPARRGRRRLRRRLPGWRMFRRGRPGLLALQLRQPDERIDQAMEFLPGIERGERSRPLSGRIRAVERSQHVYASMPAILTK